MVRVVLRTPHLNQARKCQGEMAQAIDHADPVNWGANRFIWRIERVDDDWEVRGYSLDELDRPCQRFPGCKNAEPDKPCCIDRGMESMDV